MKKYNSNVIFLIFLLFCFTPTYNCRKLPKEMMVSTGEVSIILTNSAEVSGKAIDLGEGVIQHGHTYNIWPNVCIDSCLHTSLGILSGTGDFKSQISNLEAGTRYYIKAYLNNGSKTVYGDEKSFTTVSPSVPTLTTSIISSVTAVSAGSGGNITNDGSAQITARGCCWSISTTPTTADSKTTDGTGTGTFISSLTGLTENTTYYVRAYATNSAGTSYGNELNFKTITASLPTLSTSTITNITSNSAKSGGSITNDGGAPVTSRGVCYGLLTGVTTNDNKTTDGTGSGSFVSNISGLLNGKTYYLRAYAVNSAGTAYGNELSFSTDAVIPTLTTSAISFITSSTAVSGGTITDDGGSLVTERGVCWSISTNPTITNSKTSDGGGIGNFISNLSGLSINTTYYLRAYATNSKGTAYGNEFSFKTDAASIPIVNTTAITSITSISAISGGNVTTDGGAFVSMRGVCWNTSPNPTTANSKTSNGSGTGSYASNLYSLVANTTYYVRAYATNSIGTGYGNELSFTTSATFPTLTTTSISNITTSSASGGGNITSDGGSPVTARGVCWNQYTTPSITNSRTNEGSGTGSFTSNITGLTPGTTYNLSAYATNSIGTSYGNVVSFQTANTSVSIISSFAVPGGSPNALEWDGSSLWMVDNLNNFYKLDTLGNVLKTFAFHTEVYDLAWDGEALWAYTSTKIEKVDGNGNILSSLPISYWSGSGIAWDGSYFWISNFNDGRIYKHDPAGNMILFIEPGFFGHPTGIAFNGTDLLIGDSFEAYNNIYLYSRSGIEKSFLDIDAINLLKIKVFERKAIAWDGKNLWYSSNARFEIFKLKAVW